ncbi:MAG: VOC family protein [Microbacterium sp.]
MTQHRVRWMFHTTAMVRDYDAARNALMSLFGQRILEDTWIDNPHIARRGGMTWIGDNSLELGQPIIEGAGPDRFVARHGPGMHSIALQVEDLAATIAHSEQIGVRIIAVSDTVAFCHPKDTGGVFIEWYSGDTEIDPRFGGPMPPAGEHALDVERMAFAGAIVADPIGLAPKLAELFGTDVAFSRGEVDAAEPAAGVSLADNMLALYRMPGERSNALWGVEHREPKVHVLALTVKDTAEATAILAAEGVGAVRTDRHTVVVSPACTGHVPVLLTDELLPGDPRS